MTRATSPLSLTFQEVTPETWGDLARLFESPGGPKYCWCMAWRMTADELKDNTPPARKVYLKRRVDVGTPVGILAYHQQEPVAWCSIAPRSTYLRLGGMDYDPEENIWALACLYVTRRMRKQGVAHQLIQAALEQARQQGATVVEAYPVGPDSPSYRFMGFLDWFRTAGFEEAGMAGTRRHVMFKRIG